MAGTPDINMTHEAVSDDAVQNDVVGTAMDSPSAPQSDAIAIKLQGLSKVFAGKFTALQSVDLDIPSGEFFTLLGPSGCGKTTLLRILAGLERATSGTVEIGGKSVTNTPPHKRNVNTVFQSYALFPHLNVRENIGFGLRMRKVKKEQIKERVEQTAKFIKISELLDRQAQQLSGGQQQRVALARALINEPDVLLLDESLSALDAGLRGELQIELMRIQRRLGMTFIFVTHDQQEAMVMSDRIAVLNEGVIQQVGTPQDLYERPQNLFVARFMGHSNLFPVRSQTGEGVQSDLGWIAGRFEPGTHVLIRPEIIELSAAPADPADKPLQATVQECIYRGSVAEYRLRCGETVLVAKCNNIGQRMFTVGDTVAVAIEGHGVVTVNG